MSKSKRKYSDVELSDSDCEFFKKEYTPPVKRVKFTEKENLCPSVETLQDLISIGKSMAVYTNIDMFMLWRALPYLEELEKMIGLVSLKKTVLYQILYYLQELHTKNRNEEYLHTVIIGSSGTGKTSVAQIIGKLYESMGVLSENSSFKIAHREDLIAGYLGQTAIKTKALLKSCEGGVLFIDEVYSLGSKENRDSFSKEALDTLTAFLSENKNNFCCIIAGYEKDIEECFFANNSGLKRRFPWVHKIDGYSPKEMTEILLKMIADIGWKTDVSQSGLIEFMTVNKELFSCFGGDIETFLSKCKMVHSKRVFSMDRKYKFILSIKDMEEALKSIKETKTVKADPVPFGMYS